KDAGSWLAVCSSQGLRWVTERTGEPEFPEQAKDLSVKWLKRLHRQQARHASRMPEPDQATAWKYAQGSATTAFFAEDFGRFVCVVPPAEFKCKLSLHFEGRLGHAPDPAWYALRHTVYASGCRILLSKDPTGTFSDAQAQSWKYFENAMAVHLELLYSRTDVHTVRALVAMTQYLEHSGDPSLSYIMCGNAARLAQSIGLHRRPDNSRSLHHDGNHQDASDDEAVVKTWLFWAIYALDKFISQRLGRPSAIDDKTITCGIPLRRPENSMLDLGFCTQMIKLGRIRSCITQSIFDTPSELYDGSSSVVALIARLSEDLRRWRHDYIRSIVEAHTSSTGCQAPAQPCVGRLQRLSLELCYQSAIIHLHSAFALPWLEEGFTNSERGVSSAASVAHQALRAISSHAVSKASRCIIETVCQLTFEGSTPRWMVFQCPMLGVINLFISILKNPRAYEVQGDLSLLDAAAQHFDRLRERSDTQLSFTFAHEIAALARRTIRRVDAMSTREGNLVWDTTENDRSRRQDQRRAIDGWEDTTMLQNHANGEAPFQDAALAAMPWDWSTAIDSVDGFDMEQWEMFVNAPPCNDVSSFHSTTHATENALKTSLF
ncbi:Gypsy retrotransposon integrase-like protein 1, partial [Exophiala xenobiotica]